MSAASAAPAVFRPARRMVTSVWGGLTRPPRPLVGIEVHATALGVVKARRTRGATAALEAVVEQPLAPGVVLPSLTAPGIQDPSAFRGALKQALERAGCLGERRVALVLPDVVARIAILAPSEVTLSGGVPADDVLRFRLRDRVPFEIREARLACTPAGTGATRDWVVAAGLRDVLDGYEEPCSELGLEVGRVELSGLALLRGAMQGRETADWLLVQWGDAHVSLFLWREGALVLARTLSGAPGPTEIGREVASTVLYHRERLGGQLAGALLRVVGHPVEDVQTLLEGPLGLRPEPVGAKGFVDGAPPQPRLPMTTVGAAASVLSEEA